MNGKMERHFQTTANMARNILSFPYLPNTYWVLAFDVAVYIRNRVWSTGAKGIPFEILTGVRPDVSHFRVFGCPAYVHTPEYQQRQLSEKAWKGIFVGYCTDSPAWKIYNPVTRRVLHSRNVVFDETFGSSIPIIPPSVQPMGDCGDMLNTYVELVSNIPPVNIIPETVARRVHFDESAATVPPTNPGSSSPLLPRNLEAEPGFSSPSDDTTSGFTWLKEPSDGIALLSEVVGEPGSYKEGYGKPGV
jgi:hypothetical protein